MKIYQTKKHHNMKKLVYFPVAFAMILSTFWACKSKQKAQKMTDSMASYVYAYTSGQVSKAANIRVRFANAVAGATDIGQPIKNGVLSFTPAVIGRAIWEDDRTIVFDPENYLEPKTNYVGNIKLDKLFGNIDAANSNFQFDFHPKDQFFEVNLQGLQTVEATNIAKQELQGVLRTTDIADTKQVETLLKVSQNGNTLPIKWEHSPDNLTHNFKVQDVTRGKNDDEVSVAWDGKPIGVDYNSEQKYPVPSLSNFKIIDAKVIQDKDQYISICFSDPLKANQNLDGLISISDYKENLRYVIDRNIVNVYPTGRLSGKRTVKIEKGIKNVANKAMPTGSDWFLSFQDVKPKVRLVGHGTILPNSNGQVLPFEAINLNAVDVEVFKIYNINILQFLQTSNIDDNNENELYRVGKIVLQKKVNLKDIGVNAANQSTWSRYALDLGKLIKTDPSAIYQIRIGFRAEYSDFNCGAETNIVKSQNKETADFKLDDDGEPISITGGGYDEYYGEEEYDYSRNDNPCFQEYYTGNKFVRRNIFSSNLGIIAKKGNDKSSFVAVTDLRTTEPVVNASIEYYDFQNQLIKKINTNAEGIAETTLEHNAFVMVVSKGDERGYLKLDDGNSLSLSRFDVAGEVIQKGLKGFIYGERGVWRPGDSLFLDFILEDQSGLLPKDFPVTVEMKDPRNMLMQRFTTTRNINHIYPIHTFTRSDAPTGNYTVNVKVGGASFTKNLIIETVKPNRLKINFDFGKNILTSKDGDLSAKLQSNWLTGAPARGLGAKVDVQLKSVPTTFEKYESYTFDDPARSYASEPQTFFEGDLDDNGMANVAGAINIEGQAPGKLMATFKTRVIEKGGDFSIDNFSMPYYSYPTYIGVNMPRDKQQNKQAKVGQNNTINIVALDPFGKPKANAKINVELYRINWRWWWDSGNDYVSEFNNNESKTAIKKGVLKTNAKGQIDWKVSVSEWGRYFVRVVDTEGGHATGDFFNAGYPWDEDDFTPDQDSRAAAAMLDFKVNKEKYAVGDQIELTIPTGEVGRCLITIENGSKVLQHYWMTAKAGENKFTFPATPDMAPTVYAHVTLIQPHGQVKNDLPIRLYGIVPVNVEDLGTRLQPVASMPDVLEPEQTFTMNVKEQSGNAMAYTIAVVDEGLLDLTRFKTPDPWTSFYAREALGVKTWDIYDQVLGAYGGELEKILSIGGDGVNRNAKDNKANRFKPVVMHLGPFYLPKGQSATHKIKLPNYIGSVRTMIVAANNGQYGNFEKATPVRKPLMLLTTLPRVLGPGETLKLPVTIFAMEDKVKNVNIRVEETSGLIDIVGGNSKSLSFAKPGEDVIEFDIKVKDKIGIAKFRVIAEGAGERAYEDLEIDVRNPNPVITTVVNKDMATNETWNQTISIMGSTGTNEGILEISSIPPINIGSRLKYLITYPGGCVEQTTSTAFPQLYVSKLLELTDEQKLAASSNVKTALERLSRFQVESGGFSYWPGGNAYADYYSSSYVGHFMLEAQRLGFTLPIGMLDRWKNYQKNVSRTWDPAYMNGWNIGQAELDQTYRLYTMALADIPDLGVMNRLRENKGLSPMGRWNLAAAFAKIGKPEIARELIANLPKVATPYNEMSHTYGSDLRDEAMMLETFMALGDKSAAAEVTKNIAQKLSSQQWYSTQSTAYSMMAVSKFIGDTPIDSKYTFNYQLGNGQVISAGSSSPFVQIPVKLDEGVRKIMVKNTGKNILFARLIISGQPTNGDNTTAQNNLAMSVMYKDMKGENIDVSGIRQGQDFIAEVTVKNPGTLNKDYEELMLSQIFPSGWEIHNVRISGIDAGKNSPMDYRDIRDDRVMTYFDLKSTAEHKYYVYLNAAYLGRYYLPTLSCDAMYDNNVHAHLPGQWVEVKAKPVGEM